MRLKSHTEQKLTEPAKNLIEMGKHLVNLMI
jgi:hypothetical protein